MKSTRRILMYGIPKSFLIKIILVLLLLLIGKKFLLLDTYAQDFNVSSSDISSPNSSGSGKYTGTEIYNSGTANVYNLGTRYNGRLSRIVFNLASGGYADPEGFEKGHTYTLSLNMATSDWRNKFGSVSVRCEGSSGTQLSNGRVSFISMKKIKFSFTAPSDRYCSFVYVDLKSSNISNVPFTGESNWDLSSLVISDPYYDNSGSSGSGGSTPTPTPQPNNQDIINNANQNTQDIINSNNQNTDTIINNSIDNTQDIIENANQNTQDITNSISDASKSINSGLNTLLGECYTNILDLNSETYFRNATISRTENGFRLTTTANWGYVYWIVPVQTGHTYNFNYASRPNNSVYIRIDRWYNDTPTYNYVNDYTGTNFNFSVNEAQYIRILVQTNTPQTNLEFNNFQILDPGYLNRYIPYNKPYCSSKLDETNSSINDVNNSINNSNVESGTGSDFFNDFSSTDNGGISGIITKPLVLINSLLSNNNSCNSLTFGIKFPNQNNKNVSFPSGCILWNNVPSNVVSIYHIFVVGFCSYYLLKRLFKDVEDLKNPEKDEVEVIDL